MSNEEKIVSVKLKREEGFVFRVDFGLDKVSDLNMDEPEPVGKNSGPNASKVLAAAIGNCLSASLLFCLQKARIQVHGVETGVNGFLKRNENGRWRIHKMNVGIHLELDEEKKQIQRCLDIFEDYCIVSQSIEEGIPIDVKVDYTQPSRDN